MRRAQMVCLVMAVLLAVTAALPAGAQARKDPVKIRKLSGSKERTPEYKLLTGQKMVRTKEWFVVQTEYDTDPDWIDEITFTYYIVLQGRTSDQPKNTLLTGEVTYLNVEEGRRHMSDMYLHPSTLARYGDVKGVAVLVKVDGRMVALETMPKVNQRWWEQLAPLNGLVLNRMQTPFAMINFDDYEAIKFGQ